MEYAHLYTCLIGIGKQASYCAPSDTSHGEQIANKLFEMILFNCPETNRLSIIYSRRFMSNTTLCTDIHQLNDRFTYMNSHVQKEVYDTWKMGDHVNVSHQNNTSNTIISLENLIEKSFYDIAMHCPLDEARKVVTRQTGAFICNILDQHDNLHNLFVCTAYGKSYSLDLPEFNQMIDRNDISYRHITIRLVDDNGNVVRNHLVSHVWRYTSD
jgi:hypothetical protein